jgi:hypothetical protein
MKFRRELCLPRRNFLGRAGLVAIGAAASTVVASRALAAVAP